MTSTDQGSSPEKEDPDGQVLPVVEEELRIEKREVVRSRVRVRTTIEAETEIARASLDEEAVEVTRVPIDRVVDDPPKIRTQDGVTIVPVLEEVLFVEKRLVLKEEVHIRKRVETQEASVPVELRKERVIVERLPTGEAKADKSP